MKKQILVLPLVLASFSVVAEVAPVLVAQCYAGSVALDETGRFENKTLTTDDGDFKVVNDLATGLQWAYCPYGQSVTAEGSCSGVQATMPKPDGWSTHFPIEVSKVITQENARLGEYTQLWRAPNFKEAFSIYNKDCMPNVYSNFYYAQHTQAELDEMLTEAKEVNHQAKMWWILSWLFTYATETPAKDAKKMQSIIYGYAEDAASTHGATMSLRLVRNIPAE